MISTLLDKLSFRYREKDIVLRMKAKFFILLCLAIILILPIIIAYTIHLQLNSPALNYTINYRLIGIEIAAFVAVLFIFGLLIKGHFSSAAHLLLIMAFTSVWSVMLFDTSIPLTRLDTVVIVLALLTLLPIALLQKKITILLYGFTNTVIFIVFVYHISGTDGLPYHAIGDYVSDTLVAMIFIILTGYVSFIISSTAISRVKSELARREATERALRESRQLLSDIIEFFPDPTFAVNVQRQVIIWNKGMEKLTGIPSDAIMGHNQYSLSLYGRERPLLVDYLLTKDNSIKNMYPDLFEGEDFVASEIFVPEIGEGGAYLWAAAKLLYDSNGNVAGAIESFRNTTERHRQESEKARLEEELLHARKMESVGRLAGGIAHDFNNLLTTIIGNANLLLMKTGADTPTYQRLSDIMKAAESATALTRRLLAFSRKNPIALKPIDINEEIERSAALFTPLIGEQIRLQTHLHPDALIISADAGQIEQIIINLVLNARDAMPEGGSLIIETRHVRVDTPLRGAKPALKPGNYAVLSITDTGIGMDEKVMEHLFEPFFTTKPVGKGTGLGLAMVYGAVTQLGGSILVESHAGKGTSITLFFPATDSRAVIPETTENEPGDPLGKKSILVIEDDESVRKIIIEGLSQHGYEVAGVSGKNDAMAALKNEVFDLVIADLVLADSTGVEIAEEFSRFNDTTKILFMSGHADAADKFPHIVHGANFIAKPFTIGELIRKINSLMETQK